MTIDKKELTKLSPSERIKKLRLMEEERKKEVDEIEQLIRQSMQELRTDKLAEEVAPEPRVVDISRLFETTGEEKLERTAREEAPPVALMKGAKGYHLAVQMYQDYSTLKEFYGRVSMGGGLSEEQMATVGKIGERLAKVEEYIPMGEETASILDASRVTLRKLRKETGFG